MKFLKTIFTALIVSIFCISTGTAQNFSTRFLKSADKKGMSIVSVNSSMIEALKKNEKDKDLLAFLNELTFLRVITIDDAKNAATYYCTAVSLLKKDENYEELFSTEVTQLFPSVEQKVIIAALGKADKQDKAPEIVLISYQKCQKNVSLTIVNITGNITISELDRLTKSIQKSM